MLEITKAINENISKEKLFSLYSDILKNQLNIGKVLLLINSGNEWSAEVKYGIRVKNFLFDIENDLLPIKDITSVSSKKEFHPFDIVVPVFHKNLPIAYVLLADLDEEQLQISPTIKHLPFIQTLTNIISVAVENKRLTKEHIKKQALEHELNLAHEVQEMLFPASLNIHAKLEVSARYIPHQQIGGDYYDFFKLDEQRVAFCIADVSGKGISAALLMANFQANFRALIGQSFSLRDLVRTLNKKVLHASNGDRFITFFVGIYHVGTQQLTYVNAGHLPPLLYSNNQFLYLKKGCPGLGMVDELPFVDEDKITLFPDSLLFMFTDGVAELKEVNGQFFPQETIETFVGRNAHRPINDVSKLFYRFIKKLRDNHPLDDDLTMFFCRFK
ncbi:MAG: PP2C family protein-serine/threonine phosphatase [Bacteroidia bacterium]|nr:PP2C family protein-serine/threonine phosphatase [Bacteroidia bacterium]